MKSTRRFLFHTAFLISVIFGQSACQKETSSEPEKKVVKKMVLVYMDANNDLRYDALNSINRMEKGAADLDGTLLVYIKTETATAYLLKIRYDADENRIVSDTVRTFENPPSADAQFLHGVVSYAQQQYPAESYGLVLWSHATSWAPPGSGKFKTQSFGKDAGKETDIIDLKNALPDNLEFILFDACSMGSVEVLYEFKDKAKYIIASPTETLAESFPYQSITSLLFRSPESLTAAAKAYFDYYNAYDGEMRSATVVVVKTSELVALATEMKTLLRSQKKYGDVLISSGVQRLDYTANFPVPNYDFGNFLSHNFRPSSLDGINDQIGKAILYKAATPNFLSVPIRTFSGLTCYIPNVSDANWRYYRKLQWYTSSGLNLLFDQLGDIENVSLDN